MPRHIVLPGRLSRSLPVLLLAGSFMLSGCTGGADAEPGVSPRQETEAQAPADDVQDRTETAQVPEDFPEDIPLPDADPTMATRHVNDAGINWVLQYHGDYDEDEFFSLTQELSRRGYVEEVSGGTPGQILNAVHSGEEYTVSIGLLWEGDRQILQISVLAKRDD